MSVRPQAGVSRQTNRLSQVLNVGLRAGLASKAAHTGTSGAAGAILQAAAAKERLQRLRGVYSELWTLIEKVKKRSNGALKDEKAYQNLKNVFEGAYKIFEEPGMVQRLDNRIDELTKELKMSNDEYVNMKKQLTISQEMATLAEDSLDDLAKQAEEEYAQAEAEVARLKDEAYILESRAKAAEAQVDANTASFKEELDASNEVYVNLLDQLRIRQDMATLAEDSLKDLEKRTEVTNEQYTQAKAEVARLKDEAYILESRVKAAEAQVDANTASFKEELDASNEVYVNLLDQLKIRQDMATLAEKSLSDVKEQANKQYAQAEAEVDKLKAKVARLESRAKAAEAQVDENTTSLRQGLIAQGIDHISAVLPNAEQQDQDAATKILNTIKGAMEDGNVDSSELTEVLNDADEFFDAIETLDGENISTEDADKSDDAVENISTEDADKSDDAIENISTEDAGKMMNASLELGRVMIIILNTLKSAFSSRKASVASLFLLAGIAARQSPFLLESLAAQREVPTTPEGSSTYIYPYGQPEVLR